MEPAKRKLAEEDEKQNPLLKMSRNCSKVGISDLPNAVVHHIISFGTVKDAVKTCSLSRNWKSLWTSIPNLLFHCERRQNVHDFASFVDKALMLYSAPKVKTFLLDFPFYYKLKDRVDFWLFFAVIHEVEELFLNFKHSHDPVLDEWSWTWTWPSLKVLSLVNLRLALKEIRYIFRGSPLIECLTLRSCCLTECEGDCYMIDATDIGLKNLTVDSCKVEFEDDEEYVVPCKGHVEIKGPNLLSLTVVGDMYSTGLKLEDLSSLIEANVGFTMMRSSAKEKKIIMAILEKLHHVNRIVIGAWFLQVLSIMRLDGEIFPTLTCRSLKVNTSLSKMYLPRVEVLFHTSPYLKQITLNLGPQESNILNRKNHALEENYRRAETGTCECLNQSLEKVEIIRFDASNTNWYQSWNLVEMAQFLLANAKVLQNLTIHAYVRENKLNTSLESVELWKSKNLLEIKEKVLNYPRASPNAVVVFESRNWSCSTMYSDNWCYVANIRIPKHELQNIRATS